MEHPTVFDHIAEASQKAGVRLILIGGFAVNAHGVARHTQDVDFLIDENEYSVFHDHFSSLGYQEIFRNNLFSRFENKASGVMPVDVLFLDDKTFKSIWDKGMEARMHGHVFRTPSLNHLIALKLHALKQGGERREWKDLDDIFKLVSENKFGMKELHELCQKFGPSDAYEMILRKYKSDQNG